MAPESSGNRSRRVAEALRKELSLLLAEDVKDPGAAGAVVTRVDVTGDLRSARVLVRLLDPEHADAGADPARRKELIQALGRAAGMLRREVTQRLGLRYAPELRFVYDEGVEDATRVERLLMEIAADRTKR